MATYQLRFTFVLGALLGIALLVAGCALSAPSKEEVRAEFNHYVNDANACDSEDECAYASAGCPLACPVAVRKDRVKDVEKKARDLIDDYESTHQRCYINCLTPLGVTCRAGRCVDLTTE